MSKDTWKGGNANWNIGADWSAGVPTATSDVVIDAGAAQVTAGVTVQSISLGSLGTVNFESAGTSHITGALTDAGHLLFDTGAGKGGSVLTIGAALTNSGVIKIGNATLSAADSITVAALNNFSGATHGEIDMVGAATVRDRLNVTSAAGFGIAGQLIGNVNLSGDSLIEFASGKIASIASGSELTLNGKSAFVADAASLTSNSALNALTTISGTLDLRNGASITTTGALSSDDDLW